MTSILSHLFARSTRPSVERVVPPFGRNWLVARISASMAVRSSITLRDHLEHRLMQYMRDAPQDGGPRIVFAVNESGRVLVGQEGAASTEAQLLADPSGYGEPGAGEDAAEVRSLRAQHQAAQEHANRELDDAQRRLEALNVSLADARAELAEHTKGTFASIGSGASLTAATTARGEHARGLLASLGPALMIGAASLASVFVLAESTNVFATFADFFGLDLEYGYLSALGEQTSKFVGVGSASLATSVGLVVASWMTTHFLAKLAKGGTSAREQIFDVLFALGSGAIFVGAGWAVASLRQFAGEGAIALLDAAGGGAGEAPSIGTETWAMWTLLTAFGGDMCLKGAAWAWSTRGKREEARRHERKADAERLEAGDRLGAQRALLESKERELVASTASLRDEVRALEERMREAESRLAAKLEVNRKYREAYVAAVLSALATDREQYLLAGGTVPTAAATNARHLASRTANQSGERRAVREATWRVDDHVAAPAR